MWLLLVLLLKYRKNIMFHPQHHFFKKLIVGHRIWVSCLGLWHYCGKMTRSFILRYKRTHSFSTLAVLYNSLRKAKSKGAEEKRYDMSWAVVQRCKTCRFFHLTCYKVNFGEFWWRQTRPVLAARPSTPQRLVPRKQVVFPCSSNPIHMHNCITCKLNRLDV